MYGKEISQELLDKIDELVQNFCDAKIPAIVIACPKTNEGEVYTTPLICTSMLQDDANHLLDVMYEARHEGRSYHV